MSELINRVINDITIAINPYEADGLYCGTEMAHKTKGEFAAVIEYLYYKKKRYIPMCMTWELSSKCNFNCPFCYIHASSNRDGSITFEQKIHWVDYLIDEGLLFVYLTGGEALQFPRFEELYIHLKKRGVFPVVLSNLSLLSDRYIELFKKYPPFRITVSIYGIDGETFSRVTGMSPKLCSRVLANIERLIDSGVNVTCQTPVTTLTALEIPRIGQWCSDRGIHYSFSGDISDGYNGESKKQFTVDEQTIDHLRNSVTIVNEKVSTVLSEQPDFCIKKRNYLDCIAGKYQLTWSYNNEIRPCFHLYENKFLSFNLGEMGMKQAIEQMRSRIEYYRQTAMRHCSGCDAHDFCNACELLIQQNYPDSISKRMAEECKKAIIKKFKWLTKHS